MQGTRSERDADLIGNNIGITAYKTRLNSHAAPCGVCNEIFYFDDSAFESLECAIREGGDNPFMCDDCRLYYEEMAVGH